MRYSSIQFLLVCFHAFILRAHYHASGLKSASPSLSLQRVGQVLYPYGRIEPSLAKCGRLPHSPNDKYRTRFCNHPHGRPRVDIAIIGQSMSGDKLSIYARLYLNRKDILEVEEDLLHCVYVECNFVTMLETCIHDPQNIYISQNIMKINLELSPLNRVASPNRPAKCRAHINILSYSTRLALTSSSLHFYSHGANGVVQVETTSASYRNSVDIIIFSKDRPKELKNALLSISAYVDGVQRVHVIYTYSSMCFRIGYLNVAKDIRTMPNQKTSINFIDEHASSHALGFRHHVLDILSSTDATHVIPIVGEAFFIRKINVAKVADALEAFNYASSVQLRLGTHLDAFEKLDRIYPTRFSPRVNKSRYVIEDSMNELLAFDSTVGCMHVCDDKEENISFLNDFWFSTNLNGPLYNKNILLNAWQDMDFSHPGDLEGNWYFRKPRLPRYHLMLTKAAVITNDGRNQTRPDHNHDSENICVVDDDDTIGGHLTTLYKKYEKAVLNNTRIYVK